MCHDVRFLKVLFFEYECFFLGCTGPGPHIKEGLQTMPLIEDPWDLLDYPLAETILVWIRKFLE